MSENSIIYNHVSIGHNLRGKVIENVSCDYKDILTQIYEIVAKWKCNDSIDIYIEDISILINKSFLLSLSKLQTTKNESLRINIYTNDILYLKQLREKYGIVLNKCEDLNDYCKETIIIDNLYDEKILYDNIITFFNSVYEKNNNASGLQNNNITNNDASLKLDIYYYVQDPVSILFNKFILQIRDDNADNYVKKTVKSIRKIYETDTVDMIEVLVNNFNNSIDRRELSVDSSNSITNYETYINQFIDTIKQLINNNSHKIESRYQISISIDDKAYDRIRENLLKLYNTLDKHHRNDLIKLGINTGFDTLALMLQIWKISQSGVLAYSLQGVFVKPIKTLYKSTKSIYTDTMNLIYSKDIANYLEKLITNNMIFMECIAQLSTDLLLLMSYSTGIHGLCILGDIDQKNKENRYMLFTNVNNSYSTISTNLCVLKIEQNSDIEYTNNNVRAIEENPNKNNAYIYFNNKNSSDNKSIRTQNMFEEHIKSMKYMLYIETPLYFMPYMDILLQDNFNLTKALVDHEETSRALDIIILSTSPYKWQEKFLKQQLKTSYNAVPVRYGDYDSYDIALKTNAVDDLLSNSIYIFTIFDRYSTGEIKKMFNNILSSLNNLKSMYSNNDNSNKQIVKFLDNSYKIMNNCIEILNKFGYYYYLYYYNYYYDGSDISNQLHNILDYLDIFIYNLEEIHSISEIEDINIQTQKSLLNDLETNVSKAKFILSSVRKYFFSSVEIKDIEKFRHNHTYIINEYLKQMNDDDPFSSCESKFSDSMTYINSNQSRLKYHGDNALIQYINNMVLSDKIIKLTSLRVEIYKFYLIRYSYSISTLETIIGKNFINEFSVGQEIHKKIEELLSASHFKQLIQYFKKIVLLNVGISQEFIDSHTNTGLVDNIYSIIIGTYFITQLHNYASMLDKIFIDNADNDDFYQDIMVIMCLEELCILLNCIQNINNQWITSQINFSSQEDYKIQQNIKIQVSALISGLHTELKQLYGKYITEDSDSAHIRINRGIYISKDENISYYVVIDNNTYFLKEYYSNLYYENLKAKINQSDFFYKNMFKNVSLFDETKDLLKDKIMDSACDVYGNDFVELAREDGLLQDNKTIQEYVQKSDIELIKDNFFSISDSPELSTRVLTIVDSMLCYVHTGLKWGMDKKFKTLNKSNLEDYHNYMKYLYFRSDKMAPLANINNGDIIIPGKVQNNYMIFDNSHSVFGGSSLDMTSFVDTESIYTSVSDGEISRNLFFSRIEELILPLSSHDELRRIVFYIIKKEDLYKCLAKGRKDKLKSKLKKKICKQLDDNNVDNAIDEYSELLANYGIVELFRKNYASVFNKNKTRKNKKNSTRRKNNIVLTEEQRAQEYSLFSKCLHNIARHNTRNIYIQYSGDVIEWKFIYKEEDNSTDKEGEKKEDNNVDKKEDKKVLCLMGSKKKVKHIAYLGSLALFPMENSSDMSDHDFRIEIVENESIIK